MHQFIVFLVLALIALNVFDVISTNLVLSKGRGSEANPLVALAMKYLGKKWWLYKVIILPLAIVLLMTTSVLALVVALAVDGLFAWVVYHNYLIAWRQA